jgi:hypothetical protein
MGNVHTGNPTREKNVIMMDLSEVRYEDRGWLELTETFVESVELNPGLLFSLCWIYTLPEEPG